MTTAHLLITGSELTRGETHDLNGPYLGRQLTELGVRVEKILLVPDDVELLSTSIRDSIANADLVIASGGLGPTADDYMAQVVSAVFDREIYQHPEAKRRMRERALQRFKSDDHIPSNFYKQSEVVEGADVLLNPVGLAPGMIVPTERGFMAILPGVPRELHALYHEELLPRIQERFLPVAPRIYRVKIMGVPESVAEERIQSIGIDFDRLEYGIAAKPGELLVKLIAARPEDFSLIDTACEKLVKEFTTELIALPEGLLTSDDAAVRIDHSRVIHDVLRESKLTVVTAESCTGGQVAAELTEHSGSSAYFLGGVVAYDNVVKEKRLAVPASLLSEHGAVSEPVCAAMAQGALDLYGSDIALSTTGIAGPEGGSADKPVGLVFLGLAIRNEAGEPEINVQKRVFAGDRNLVRRQSVVGILELLRRKLATQAS